MKYKFTSKSAIVLALAVMFALYLFVAGSVLAIGEDGFPLGILKGWGDIALHLGIISVMSETNPFWAEHPAAAGIPLTYPFAINFFSAMLQRIGVSGFTAFQIPMVLSAGLLFFALWLFGKHFLKRDALAVVFVAIVLFGGGLGFFQFFLDLAAGAPFSHEYTHLDDRTGGKPVYMDAPYNIVWIVPAISFFSHQRAFILGAALGALILWGILRRRWEWLILAGFLPLVHTHTFLAFAMILPVFVISDVLTAARSVSRSTSPLRSSGGAALVLGAAAPTVVGDQARGASEGLLEPPRAAVSDAHARSEHAPAPFSDAHTSILTNTPSSWLRVGAPTDALLILLYGFIAVLIALPQVIFLLSGKVDGGFFEWWPGWMAKGYENVFWFWTKNFGVVFWGWVIVLGLALWTVGGGRFPEGFRAALKRICPAGVIGRAGSGAGLERTHSNSALRPALMIASVVLFAVSHLVKFQPWEFDNGKVLLWWWVLAAMIILSAIGDLIAVRRKLGILLLALFAFFGTFAGFLDVAGRMVHLPERFHGYYGEEEVLAAEWIRANTAPREAFLTAGDPADFVPILAGRPLYLGFTGWLWSHGRGALVEERQAVISEFLITGDPRVLCESGVRYLIWDLQFEKAYPLADRAIAAPVLEPVFAQEGRTIYQLRCD